GSAVRSRFLRDKSGGTVMVKTLAIQTQLSEVLSQYIAADSLFQLVSAGSDFGGILPRRNLPLSLRRDKFGFLGCLELKNVVRKFCLGLNVGILYQAIVAAGLKELLLHRDSTGRVDPEENARNKIISQTI